MEIEILNESRLRYWCDRIDLPQEAVDVLAGIAQQVRNDETLLRVFTEFYEKTTLRGEWQCDWNELPQDPAAVAAFGKQISLFHLLGYLAALPKVEQFYLEHGIGLDILHDTMLDVRIWLCHRMDIDGYWNYRQFGWIWRHFTCQLFRLGRLQFMLMPFRDQVTAFKHKNNGEILVLADPGLPLRADGYALGAGRLRPSDQVQMDPPAEEETGWQPVFETLPEGWRGHVVSPYGQVQSTPVVLSNREWDIVLQQGDTVMDLHIPRKDPFTPETCRDSFRQAFAFFQTHFPERPFKASYCHTWFFTPQLQQILPAASNIVHFQREFYLYPFAGGPGFLWNFAIGEQYPDIASAPRDTSLRRSVLGWLEQGKEIFDLPGLMFHTPEEWGSQPYMKRWDAAH